MLKIALIIAALVVLSAGTFFLVFMRGRAQLPKEEVPKNLPGLVSEFSTPEVATSSSDSSEIVSTLSKPIPSNADSATKIALLENKIKALEQSNIQLSTRISKLESASPAPVAQTTTTSSSTSSSSKATQYIYPLGYGGSSTKTDWTEISTLTLTIDPSLYPGYSGMQLEAYMRVKDGNGTAFVRLYSSGTAITQSEVSTGSYQNTWVSSGNFTVPSKKTYTFQVKSLTGYEAFLENARVKINF